MKVPNGRLPITLTSNLGIQEQILKSRKFARRILNPYAYKAIAYARQAHNALTNYKKDCILMDPDTVDAGAFMKEIAAHAR